MLIVQPTAETGGSDQALLRMVQGLCQGWECHVVTPSEPPLRAQLEAGRASVHMTPMRRITSAVGASWWAQYAAEWPFVVHRLATLARSVRADLISSNSLHSWYGWAVARRLGLPHVWHGREIVVQSQAALLLERQLVRRYASMLISCSGAVERQFVDVIPPNRRMVVHEDVDRSVFSPRQAGRFRWLDGQAPSRPLVLFAGRIDTWKGLDVLLAAWPSVLQAVPTSTLLVAGSAVMGKEAYYQEMARLSSRTSGALWLGHVDDMPALMAEVDVLAAPSTYPEPYGLVLVEALASGARVVATDAGGAPEIVARARHGAGFLVPCGDPASLGRAVVDAIRRSGDEPRTALVEPIASDWVDIYTSVLRERTL